MEKTLLQKLDEVPPFFAFAWARAKPRGKMAGPKIVSERSGVPYRTCQRISTKISWTGIDINVASAILKACGLRIQQTHMIRKNEVNAYLRWCREKAIRPFHHLDDYEFRLFNERSKQWLEAQGSSK